MLEVDVATRETLSANALAGGVRTWRDDLISAAHSALLLFADLPSRNSALDALWTSPARRRIAADEQRRLQGVLSTKGIRK